MKKDINYINAIEPSIREARKRRGAEVLINNFILEPKYINLGAGKKYLLKTYGCQGNLADSEKIAGILEMMGYVETNDELNADFVLFTPNTIKQSVTGTASADKKLVQDYVKLLLGLETVPKPDHAADALAAAITHIHLRKL